ncbi:MAG: alpha/beta hydrolase [Proteobacteria bacterium]|nr:alpha/beta hydrolase [Pseudomonadota bacterium]MCP4915955.1 alpha/beta hydrolase [Pseudomonadota bacterium]
MVTLMWMMGCAAGLDDQVWLRVDDADLRLRLQGDESTGLYVVVLHGGPGGNGHEYDLGTWIRDMEERGVVVTYDQRGQGASRGSYDASTITLQRMADDTEAVVQYVRSRGGQDADIVLLGHSWGGTLGTAALLRTDVQDELAGWVESDGAHDIPLLNRYALEMFRDVGAAEIAAGRNVRSWNEMVSFAEGVDPNDVTLDEGSTINSYGFTAEGLLVEGWDESVAPGEALAWGLGSPVPWIAGFASGNETSSLLLDEVEATSMTDELGDITVPTLLLWGGYDFVCPPQLGVDADERIPDSELVVFSESGHSPMDSEAEAFSQALTGWLDTL